jgi:hypothetical protein
MMIKFNPVTPIVFYVSVSEYVKGVGQTETWQEIGALYGEWKGSFGDRRLNAQALGVSDSATVRTFYHPEIYQKLKTCRTVVVKNADPTAIENGEPDKLNPNCYEVWGGVDNVLEANQYMEFSVRRYEGL